MESELASANRGKERAEAEAETGRLAMSAGAEEAERLREGAREARAQRAEAERAQGAAERRASALGEEVEALRRRCE